jgi:hypothetical protein
VLEGLRLVFVVLLCVGSSWKELEQICGATLARHVGITIEY